LLALTQDSDGSMAYELFEIRGVLLGISDSIDGSGIFMIQESFRELITMPEGAHQIIVRRPGDLDLPSLLREVEDLAVRLDVKTWREMIDLAARLGGGHVSIQNAEYLDTPLLRHSVRESAELREMAVEDDEVLRAVTRISGQIMLSTAGKSYGAGFIGIDPLEEDVETLSLIEAIDEGERLQSSRGNQIILGRRLAENLGVRLKSKVIYTLTDPKGEIIYGVERVSGILTTGAPTVDSGLSILPIDTLRENLGMTDGEATQIALFLEDHREADRGRGLRKRERQRCRR
jgi:ABC-type lipoprotein release transport system permease subunit